jgi:hypothetical protein
LNINQFYKSLNLFILELFTYSFLIHGAGDGRF